MRCSEHGLAAGPGGACVVCLRDGRARSERRARWLAAAFFAVVVLGSGALIAARAPRTSASLAAPQRVATLAAAQPAEPAPLMPSPSHEAPPESSPASAPSVDERRENEPNSLDSGAGAQAPALAVSALATAAPAPSVRGPSKREVMAALRSTPVTMFSTSWCPHCQRARQFFLVYGLTVVDHDIDADAQAAAELKRRSGGKAVPLIDVDGRELKGFDERATMQAVVASVERRLGVTGVKLSVASVPN